MEEQPAREIKPWSTQTKKIDRYGHPESNEDDATEIAPVLLFGSLEFLDTRPNAVDMRAKVTPTQPASPEKETVDSSADAYPKEMKNSSVTEGAVSSPEDSEKSGNTPTGTTTTPVIHPSLLSERQEAHANAEKDPSQVLIPHLE